MRAMSRNSERQGRGEVPPLLATAGLAARNCSACMGAAHTASTPGRGTEGLERPIGLLGPDCAQRPGGRRGPVTVTVTVTVTAHGHGPRSTAHGHGPRFEPEDEPWTDDDTTTFTGSTRTAALYSCTDASGGWSPGSLAGKPTCEAR